MTNTQHTQLRIEQRGFDTTAEKLATIASRYSQDTAVILGKVDSQEIRGAKDLLILIVRSQRPVTVFTRRQSQSLDKRHLQVNQIVYL
jgi:hypothetical protein